MNALVAIDIDTLTPATVFVPGGVEGIVSKLEAEVRAIVTDISTQAGRDAVKSLAFKVARSKTALDEMGKELVAGIKAKASLIDADRRTIRDRLDILKEEVRAPLTAWEQAETTRVDGHERAIVAMVEGHTFPTPPTSAQIMARQDELASLANRDWEEFQERGWTAYQETVGKLETMLAAVIRHEADAGELAELRRQKAEREELDRAEAAEQQRAEQAAVDAERQRANAKALSEQITRDQEAAAARAVEAERKRVADAEAAEDHAREKREANAKHRAKIQRAISAAFGEVLDAENTELAVAALVNGAIPHVSINY